MPEWSAIEDWLYRHEYVLWASFAIGFLTLLGAIFVLPLLLARMPADHFLQPVPPPGSWRRRHPLVRLALLVVKNFAGVLLVAAGVAMLFLPGQGALTIFAGIACLDFPGKRRLELFLIRLPRVLRAVNWLRGRAGRPPLQVPPRERTRDSA